MNSFDITAEFFHQQIEHISLAADAVAGMAEAAAPAVAGAMMAERKVYSIGSSIDANLANTFCHLIRDGLGSERPNLPIIPLTSSAAEPIDAGAQWLAREIRTLGHPGDVAVVWGSQLTPAGVDSLHSALAQREMASFWIGTSSPNAELPFPEATAAVRQALRSRTTVARTRILARGVCDHGSAVA